MKDKASQAKEDGRTGKGVRAGRTSAVVFGFAALLFSFAAARITAPVPGLFQSGPEHYRHTGYLSDFTDRGKVLLYGITDGGATYSMPLLSAVSAASPDNYSKNLLNRFIFALHFGIYFLCFMLGNGAGGPACGILTGFFALAANLALKNNFEIEQLFFTFYTMLFLNLLIYRQRNPDWLRSSLLGLSTGCTLLIRSDLFFIPFAVLLLDQARPETPPVQTPAPAGPSTGRKLIAAAALVGFSYALLLPWLGVTYYLHKSVIPFESERGTCNMITGVMGSVYTMEGDCRSLAGLSPHDSAFAWAARKVVSAPYKYFLSVLKRLLHIFYMFPFLFILAAAGYFVSKRSEAARSAAMFVLYFVLLHSLVSIEPRYFYSLRYALAFLGALGLSRFTGPGRETGTPALALGVFVCALLPVLPLEAVLVSYPFRAKPELAALEAALRSHSDPWLWEKRGDYLCREGRTKDGIDSYFRALENSGGKDLRLAYILATLRAPAGAAIKPPDADLGLDTTDLWALKSLKELEYSEIENAKSSLYTAYELWNGRGNTLRGTPYRTDYDILLKIHGTNSVFWDYHIKNCLYYWPPETRRILLQRLSKISKLTPELEKLSR